MKITTITTANTKGQVVIPASIRNALGISSDVPLQITLKGNVIQIVPIKDVITLEDQESSYLDILKKTQGSWENDEELQDKGKKELELAASLKRKSQW